ncbi:MAG: tetratricopeptide repeat protein [Bacteroidetes bacterium]|nr:tetratricopeptide repeat protein [Bacteroidota bacterium]
MSKHFLLIISFILTLNLVGNSQQAVQEYTDYDRGYYYRYYNKLDSAFLYFNRYVNNPSDTLKKGKAYNYMAEMQWSLGDPYGAQQSLVGTLSTLDSLNPNHRKEVAQAYNLLGNINVDLKLYDQSVSDYQHAVALFNGSDSVLEAMNGMAIALQKKGNYKGSIHIYDSIIALKPSDPLLLARIVDNRARTQWLADPSYQPLAEFHAALKIRVDSQYAPGLNASYAHLSDYYAATNPDSAIWYAKKMLQIAKQNRSPEDILEAIDKLIRLNTSSEEKVTLFSEHQYLKDSLQFYKDTTNSRFALIRYDYQKSKADNLVLQQHISKQRLYLFGLGVLAFAVITALYIRYKKRRKRIKEESEKAIRDSQLKTSQKVHDVVANGLYGIMNELEHTNTLDREPLMTKIEVLYEKSRNISYEESLGGDALEYDQEIHQLLNSYSSDKTAVLIVGNQPAFWNKVSAYQKKELQLILNEIMVNMKKHSRANKVVIIFKQEANKGYINYKDDGIGFAPGFEFGNGLKNTVSRINSINGAVTFGNSGEKGASIAFSFPLEP